MISIMRIFIYEAIIIYSNFSVFYIRSTGILQRLQEKWIHNDVTREEKKVSTFQVTIWHTRSVFVFYGVAIIISLVVLGLEILYNKYVNSNVSVISYTN